MKGTLLATLLLTAAASTALAQQQPQFSHYGFNGMYLNPAYAGIKGQGDITAIVRNQYFNYKGSVDSGGDEKVGVLTANLPIAAIGGGVGLTIYHDVIAEQGITSGALSYSKHLKVGDEGRLGLGVQGIFHNINHGDYRAVDPNDPNVPLNSSDRKFDAGVGVWYESPTWYAGLSVNNLLRSKFKFQSEGGGKTAQMTAANHGYLTVGYNFDLADAVVLTPTAIAKIVIPGKSGFAIDNNSFEVGARATVNDKFWGGLGYRYQESFTGMAGVAFAKDNALRLGYAFDFIAFNQDARALSSHEIMLSYRLPKPGLAVRPAIRTPRYSF
ncbi:type IX secretion system membrane protein PorP/SprF [Hymenobacter busanensis]|uniref:Type IX secretion system membrane protein PorP/SprF n=1 Tax=Hymenobacter busanensis TaxID=2607656 RepID=A0A7L5A018_9BACT|nr:PorP/SprF family type IX secretion system membrane protein [Hymenobacter busanensis]KAA9331462.1 type IX secretion system membrane protein PorP/SprF [Hymenobacter busanensis]QHJ08617.1 type IX secretion system membrane protein PorP/SprF [Hymenobacter busanensis]